MNTYTEIARITEELRALINTDNDTPRLIAEMVSREFPECASLVAEPELSELIRQVEDLKQQVDDLENKDED